MAGKTFTLKDFGKSALDKEQMASLKGGNVNYLRQRTAREMTRISWEGLDIRIAVQGDDSEVNQTIELSQRLIALR